MAQRTVEEVYQKKTQHEHILARPDMYIGTIEPVTEDMWVYDEADCVMKLQRCTWTPGLYKIFDEILVNAADNKVRDPHGQTAIKVWIDTERGVIRVYNNGEGIPVQRHREHDLWVPEMIFGHLLTSSNYDDTEAKVTGGRNGFGAKLTNVFSTCFELETVHSRSRKKFFMRWRNNMLESEEPVITSCDGPDYTMVTFYPDFAKFKLQGLSEDMALIMKRRVYDIAGCTEKSLSCYLNGGKIPCRSFAEYVDLYPTMGEERRPGSYSRVNDRWEVCVRVSNIGFQQVSFVNSIATTRGGTHVKYVVEQIIAKVTEQAMRKSKTEVKPHMIRPHMFVFVNCLIENPSFDSQTKETLNTPKTRFGSVCDLPASLIDCVLKSSIVERAVEMANSKLSQEMAMKLRNSNRKQVLGIPKLDDANEAGGENSHRCTLILTEGDSAKALCTAGLSLKDRDYFGVFPLRGKPLNVRDASIKKVMSCAEFQAICKIMGLDVTQKYTSVEGLRYGHLMIMSDQDHDGSHIKGLIINMIHNYWPDLLKVPGFLQQFITPIMKARKKSRGNGDEGAISFFSMPDYFEWKNAVGDNIKNYELRYYKGLGTSTAKEGREYFENIDRHRLNFVYEDKKDDDDIIMAFAKDKVDERKRWITDFKANTNINESMNYNVRNVTYSEFVHKELILFSVADCERSIPSVVDGLKPGQRKIMFSAFKRNLVRSIKVAQLAGYVSEHAAYHHGEQSLVQTIVGLAQDYVGANNIPLLHRDGQFGTRLQGGKDHAAGRYISTRLTNIARRIYHPSDDFVVDYKDDDGLSVEPFYYVPVIPMVLVNGTAGIGTGFATNIPNYSPLDVIDNLRRLLSGDDLRPMKPWYFGFTGTIEEREKGKFVSSGRYTVRPDGVVCITELPIGTWTSQYKKFLEDLRKREIVVQYREHNTDVTVDFEVFIHPEVLQQWTNQGCLEDKLQLREYINATNIIAFDREGRITNYADAESVLKEFYLVRLEYYARRQKFLVNHVDYTVVKLNNMIRFVNEVVNGTFVVTRRPMKEVLADLQQRGYTPFPPQQKKKVSSTTINDGNNLTVNDDRVVDSLIDGSYHFSCAVDNFFFNYEGCDCDDLKRSARDYDYLLGLRLWNLTAEMSARLLAQLEAARAKCETIAKCSPSDLWREDLDLLQPEVEKLFEERTKEIAALVRRRSAKPPLEVSAVHRRPLGKEKLKRILRASSRIGIRRAQRGSYGTDDQSQAAALDDSDGDDSVGYVQYLVENYGLSATSQTLEEPPSAEGISPTAPLGGLGGGVCDKGELFVPPHETTVDIPPVEPPVLHYTSSTEETSLSNTEAHEISMENVVALETISSIHRAASPPGTQPLVLGGESQVAAADDDVVMVGMTPAKRPRNSFYSGRLFPGISSGATPPSRGETQTNAAGNAVVPAASPPGTQPLVLGGESQVAAADDDVVMVGMTPAKRPRSSFYSGRLFPGISSGATPPSRGETQTNAAGNAVVPAASPPGTQPLVLGGESQVAAADDDVVMVGMTPAKRPRNSFYSGRLFPGISSGATPPSRGETQTNAAGNAVVPAASPPGTQPLVLGGESQVAAADDDVVMVGMTPAKRPRTLADQSTAGWGAE